MRVQGHGCPLSDILREIEYGIPVMVLAHLDEVVGTSVRKQIHPFFGIVGLRR